MFCEIYSLKENWVPVQRYPFKRSGWGCAAAKAKEKHCLLALTTDNGSPPDRMMPGNYINIQQSIFKKAFLYILFFLPNLWEENQRSFEPLSRYCWSLAGANFSNQNCHSPVSNLSNIYWNMKTCQNFTKCNLRKSFIRFCRSTQSFKWESKSFEW